MKKKLRIYANTHTTGKNQSKKTHSLGYNERCGSRYIDGDVCLYRQSLSLSLSECVSIARMSIKSKTLRRHHHHPPALDNSSNDLCVVCSLRFNQIHSSYRNEETWENNVGRNGYMTTFVALCERGDQKKKKKRKEKRVRRFGDKTSTTR